MSGFSYGMTRWQDHLTHACRHHGSARSFPEEEEERGGGVFGAGKTLY